MGIVTLVFKHLVIPAVIFAFLLHTGTQYLGGSSELVYVISSAGAFGTLVVSLKL